MEGAPNNSEGYVIRLTEDREVIKRKLDEYRGRLSPYTPPEKQLDTVYKIEVAEKLVNEGEVDVGLLSKELNERYAYLDVDLFRNACGVIEDYVKTGGKNNTGGTGLPKLDHEDVEGGLVM